MPLRMSYTLYSLPKVSSIFLFHIPRGIDSSGSFGDLEYPFASLTAMKLKPPFWTPCPSKGSSHDLPSHVSSPVFKAMLPFRCQVHSAQEHGSFGHPWVLWSTRFSLCHRDKRYSVCGEICLFIYQRSIK